MFYTKDVSRSFIITLALCLVGGVLLIFTSEDNSSVRPKPASTHAKSELPKKGSGFKSLRKEYLEEDEDEGILPNIPGGIHYIPPEDGGAVDLLGDSENEENLGAPFPTPRAGEDIVTSLAPLLLTPKGIDNTDEGAPEIAALKEIQVITEREEGRPRESTNIGGVVVRTATTPTAIPATPTPEITPTPVATPRFGGQPRGFTLLYLMHPRARDSVERSLETLEEADIQEVAIGVLTDGTFGKDFGYLSSVVRRLNERNRIVVLSLYLTNGATQRQWDLTPINAGFVNIDPEYFRTLIRFDSATRDEFASMVREVKPIFELNARLNERNQNIAIMMLEDNLDRDSYVAMKEIARREFGTIRVDYMRNPCEGCYDGNDGDSAGDGVERHSHNALPGLTIRDSISFDGFGYRYPDENEEEDEKAISFEDAFSLMERAAQKELRYVALWRKDRQGLAVQPAPHPDQRNYAAASRDQIEHDARLLRAGLSSVE